MSKRLIAVIEALHPSLSIVMVLHRRQDDDVFQNLSTHVFIHEQKRKLHHHLRI